MPPVHSPGFSTACQQGIEDVMRDMSEFGKLASATGAAIIALIPIILSTAGPPTADISELFLAGEGLISYMSAGLTFGLPTAQLRSRPPIQAENVFDDGALQSPYVHASKFWRHGWIYRTLFVIVQIVLLFTLLFLNSLPIFGDIHPIWVCDGTPQLALHLSLGCLCLAVGLVWYLSLQLTYSKHKYAKKSLVLYPSDNLLELNKGFIARLLAGFAQVIIIITLTAVFGSVYGASIATSLIRVATVVVYVFSSRTLSVWYSRCICAQKVFVTYEDETKKNSIINRYNRIHPSSSTQSQVLGSQQQAIPSTVPRIPTSVLEGISMRTEESNSLLTRALDHSDTT